MQCFLNIWSLAFSFSSKTVAQGQEQSLRVRKEKFPRLNKYSRGQEGVSQRGQDAVAHGKGIPEDTAKNSTSVRLLRKMTLLQIEAFNAI